MSSFTQAEGTPPQKIRNKDKHETFYQNYIPTYQISSKTLTCITFTLITFRTVGNVKGYSALAKVFKMGNCTW